MSRKAPPGKTCPSANDGCGLWRHRRRSPAADQNCHCRPQPMSSGRTLRRPWFCGASGRHGERHSCDQLLQLPTLQCSTKQGRPPTPPLFPQPTSQPARPPDSRVPLLSLSTWCFGNAVDAERGKPTPSDGLLLVPIDLTATTAVVASQQRQQRPQQGSPSFPRAVGCRSAAGSRQDRERKADVPCPGSTPHRRRSRQHDGNLCTSVSLSASVATTTTSTTTAT